MNRAAAALTWQEASRRHLEGALADLYGRLSGQARETTTDRLDSGSDTALERLATRFGLSAFERDLLLLGAGYELDERFGSLLASVAGIQGRCRPTFSLASSMLKTGHWSAVAPDSVLRQGRLMRVESGAGLAASPLVVEEAVLNELIGRPRLDRRLRSILDPLPSLPEGSLLPSHQRTVSRMTAIWRDHQAGSARPTIQIVGGEISLQRQIVAAAAAEVGFEALLLDPLLLPEDPLASEELLALWQRDTVLHGFLLLIEMDDGPGMGWRLARRWLERINGLVVVTGKVPSEVVQCPLVRVEVEPANTSEQVRIWQGAMGDLAGRLNGQLEVLAQQFPLPPKSVLEIAAEARGLAAEVNDRLPEEIWRLARLKARGGLDALAQRLEPRASWDDLVLPVAQRETLRSLASHVQQRTRVYDEWGFAHKSARGLGLSALFTGPSGTGKTMAAEVLAGLLELDLFRIDLSSTVNKYIGETEKNLSRLFEAAERSGAILLFDEADALFGKRSEVRHGQDRYANLEVSYLLQRIEAYRGLAILTTNLEGNLDRAFVRRLRFVIQFPFPGAVEREEIWRRVFPDEAPRQGLDYSVLAELPVSGGHIRNIALGAAFRAADERRPISMNDLADAAQSELAKSGQSTGEARLRRWRS